MESCGHESEEMVAQRCHGRSPSGSLKIKYTNIDGLVSSLLELKDYLKNNKPDVACLTETKLKEEIKMRFAKEGYSTWKRGKKGKRGEGVMILVKEDIVVEEVEYGDGMMETLSVVIKIKGSKKKGKLL